MRDPGLQPERTALAWRRTAAALCVGSLYVIRTGWQSHVLLITTLGGGMLLVSIFMIVAATARSKGILREGAHPSAIVWYIPAIVTVMTVLLGVVGIIDILMRHKF